MTVLVADGTNLSHRAWHASGGTPDRALGLIRSMVATAAGYCAAQTALVCFDGEEADQARRMVMPGYKSGRSDRPQEQKEFLSQVHLRLAEQGLACARFDGFEADDLLAQAAEQFDDVVLFTSDKDALARLAIPGVRLLRPGTPPEWVTPESVQERFGVTPEEYPLFCALRGDPSDGIPGVSGIGPKMAAALISAIGDAEELVSDISNGAPRTAEAIGKKRAERLSSNPDEFVRTIKVNLSVIAARPLHERLPDPGGQ